MSELTINLECASPKVLKALGKMMTELGGGDVVSQYEESSPADPKPVTTAEVPDVVPDATVVNPPSSATPATEQDSVSDVPDQACVQSTDKDGLPWDERIHSSNRKMTAKGFWQKRKGLAEGVYDQVKAEILGTVTTSEEPNPFDQQPVTGTIPNNAGTAGPGVFDQNPVVTEPTELNWPTMLQRISQGQVAGKLTKDTLEAWLQQNGVNGGVALMATRTELFQPLIDHFGI